MKIFFPAVLTIVSTLTFAQKKDNVVPYVFEDSVRAAAFYAETSIPGNGGQLTFAGIGNDGALVVLSGTNETKSIMMQFSSKAKVVATGVDVKKKGRRKLVWNHNWQFDSTYSLMIVKASDSAENFSIYSGYIFLPDAKKWKLIGTVKQKGQWGPIRNMVTFNGGKPNTTNAVFRRQFVQRSNNSWKKLGDENSTPPVINLASHVDSITQHQKEISYLLQRKESDGMQSKDDVFYQILKQGEGKKLNVTDTVEVFYKGYLLENGAVFDQTSDKPARFPLNRLIRGWQIGVPLINVGGKIKIFIPSTLAYSVRTRSPKIPPNSILVFEVEVLSAKSPQ